MVEDKQPGVETELHEKEGSLRRGWPALLFTLWMIAAAVYAFSPRHYPPFPDTRVHADGFIANSLARQGGRYVVAGELGHILTTESPDGDWREVEIEPHRSATLTRVRFVADDVALAVGHSGWIVRSDDGGRSWQEVRFDEDSSDPLLGIAGPFDGKLFAFGSFGQMLVSEDLGRTWQAREFEMTKPGEVGKADDEETSGDGGKPAEDKDYDPFAAFDAGGGVQALAQRHLYAMARIGDGSLLLVGERGLLARSRDRGQTWTELDKIYDGSFYGVLTLGGGRILVYGMRGHAYYSDDNGRSWQRSRIASDESLFGGAVTDDGRIVLVGDSNTLLVSDDRGQSFTKVSEHGSYGLVSILPLPGGAWLTVGEGGVAVRQLSGRSMATAEEQQ